MVTIEMNKIIKHCTNIINKFIRIIVQGKSLLHNRKLKPKYSKNRHCYNAQSRR